MLLHLYMHAAVAAAALLAWQCCQQPWIAAHLLVASTKQCLRPQLTPADCWTHHPVKITTRSTMRHVKLATRQHIAAQQWLHVKCYLQCCCVAERANRPALIGVAHNIVLFCSDGDDRGEERSKIACAWCKDWVLRASMGLLKLLMHFARAVL